MGKTKEPAPARELKPRKGRLFERVQGLDPESTFIMLCNEIDCLREEIRELRPRKGHGAKVRAETAGITTFQAWAHYQKAYMKRYGTLPFNSKRNQAWSHKVLLIAGAKTLDVITAYLKDEKPQILEEKHSMRMLQALAADYLDADDGDEDEAA